MAENIGAARTRTGRISHASSGETAANILVAARRSFADHGFAGTTLQGIAREAGVATKLVRYYYTDKDQLFQRCLVIPEAVTKGIAVVSGTPLAERGRAIVRFQLACWNDPDVALTMRTILLIAGHEASAMQRVRALFAETLVPTASAGIAPAEAEVRGGLITGQLIGLAIARYVYRVDQATAAPDEFLVEVVGDTVQRYLTGPLPALTGPAGSPGTPHRSRRGARMPPE